MPTADDLARIRAVGAFARSDDAFSVRQSRDKMTSTGAVLGGVFGLASGVLGLAIESSNRAAGDAKRARTVLAALGDFDASALLRDRVVTALRAANAFRVVESVKDTAPTTLQAAGLDAVLEMTVQEWGLRGCTTSDYSEDLQPALRVHARLLPVGAEKAIWERREIFVDGECRPLQHFAPPAETLRPALTRAVEELARRFTNELRYP